MPIAKVRNRKLNHLLIFIISIFINKKSNCSNGHINYKKILTENRYQIYMIILKEKYKYIVSRRTHVCGSS